MEMAVREGGVSGRVWVWGSAHVDLTLSVGRFPTPGETTTASTLTRGFGGKGANQAVAAAIAGASVHFVGRVGDDLDGIAVATNLKARGIDVSRMDVDATLPTGLALVVVDPDGENFIVVSPGAGGTAPRARLEDDLSEISPGDVLLVQCERPVGRVEDVIRFSAPRGVSIVLNLAPYVALASDVLKAVRVLVVNEAEAAALLGAERVAQPAEVATTLAEQLGTNCIITLGASGSVLGRPGFATLHVPASPTEKVIDTTGAGDAYVGTLAAAYAETPDLAAAMERASRAAARVVQLPGAQPPSPAPSTT